MYGGDIFGSALSMLSRAWADTAPELTWLLLREEFGQAERTGSYEDLGRCVLCSPSQLGDDLGPNRKGQGPRDSFVLRGPSSGGIHMSLGAVTQRNA